VNDHQKLGTLRDALALVASADREDMTR